MDKKFIILFGSGVMALSPMIGAQDNANANSLPLIQTVKYQQAVEAELAQGERALLPPGVKEKLRLTPDQLGDLKPIENDFTTAATQYETANQPRIDAAREAIKQARMAKDKVRTQDAYRQLQAVWAGLQSYRSQAVKQVRGLLMPDQLAILDDPQNQWSENHGSETNDPSAN